TPVISRFIICCISRRERLANGWKETMEEPNRRCSSPFPRTPGGLPTGRPSSSGSRSVRTKAWSGCHGARSRGFRPSGPAPSVEAYYLQRTGFEGIVERKIRRRQLTDDGNVEISGRTCAKMPELTLPPWVELGQRRNSSRDNKALSTQGQRASS